MTLLKYYYILALILLSTTGIAQDRMIKSLHEKLSDKNLEQNENALLKENGYFTKSHALSSYNTPKVTISHISEHEVDNPQLRQKISATTYTPTVKVAIASKIPTAYISCNTYRIKDGKLYALDHVEYNVQETEPNTAYKITGSRSYAAHSVLSSGDWYKIALSQETICKLDHGFLSSMLGTSGSIKSNSIHVYGNGGQMLEWNASLVPDDDLQQIPIKIYDGGDGNIDAGDYILFYASGPDTRYWDYDQQQYAHKRNRYEDKSYYFIKKGNGIPKTIQAQNLSNADYSSAKVYQHIYREQDSTIIDIAGGYWLGDAIGGSTTHKSLSYSLESTLNNQKTLTHIELAYHSNTSNANLRMTANGEDIAQSSFSFYGTGYGDPVADQRSFYDSINTSPTVVLDFSMSSGSFSDRGYIKSLDLTVPSKINTGAKGVMFFGDGAAATQGSIGAYTVTGSASGKEVWDVTDIHEVRQLPIQTLSGTAQIISQLDSSSWYVLLDPSRDGQLPELIGKVQNQDLHAHSAKDLIIVTHPSFESVAERLADYRISLGMSARVVMIEDIYNEYSSGGQDPVAIRDYLKMLYDKAATAEAAPKNLLLFGDASFDYKNRLFTTDNTNFVPTIETSDSVRINAFNTDDFFGFLDDTENPLVLDPLALDIGVGRITCRSLDQANLVVNKIEHYESPKSFGNWKLKNVYLADNADPSGSSHMQDAESVSYSVDTVNKLPNNLKAYGDAYTLVSTGGGSRLPDFNTQINSFVNQGALIVNYNGHGGYKGLGQEGFLTLNDINNWKNPNNLPIFITATCDFSKFDFPDLESAGEKVLLNNENGGIALVTTTQAVYKSANKEINTYYLVDQFVPTQQGLSTMGEAWKNAKNENYNGPHSLFNTLNYQKFVLLGDPSMRPAYPEHKVVIDSITRMDDGSKVDTLQARGRYTMHGHIQNQNGQVLTNYSGTLLPSIYDKPKEFKTVYHYPGVPIRTFKQQNSIVYKGNATIRDGFFSTNFILPKDIQYQYGAGKISTYAYNQSEDGGGAEFGYYIGGEDTSVAEDTEPPILEAFLNDENFVDGGITHKDPVLLLHLEDISGINTSGSSIGHDLIAVLDDNPNETFVLNDYYTAAPNDFTKGTVNYPMYNIEPGQHHLSIKVWDGANNSASARINFEVVNQDDLKLKHVFNYPNPFSTSTDFMFEHNFPNEILNIKLTIYSMSGKVVKKIHRQSMASGTRIDDIHWDARDDFGDKIGNGTYYYTLEVSTESGKSAKKLEKLYILN